MNTGDHFIKISQTTIFDEIQIIEDFIQQQKSINEYFNDEFYVDYINSHLKHRHPGEKSVLIEGEKFIIDIEALYGNSFHLNHLHRSLSYYPFNNLNEVKLLVWKMALSNSGLFDFFKNITSCLISKIPPETINETFDWGCYFSGYKEYHDFIECLSGIPSLNVYFDFHFGILIDNYSTNSRREYSWGINEKNIQIKIPNPKTNYDHEERYDIIGSLFWTQEEKDIESTILKKYEKIFYSVLETPIPTKSKFADLYEDFIHFVWVKFNKYELPKYSPDFR